jgi:hypothetical protein
MFVAVKCDMFDASSWFPPPHPRVIMPCDVDNIVDVHAS